MSVFKGVLRKFWEDFVTNIVTNRNKTDQQRESFKLPYPSRQNIVNWIAGGINYLKNHLDMIEDSFHVCEITTNDPCKVRNFEFIKKMMNSVKDKLADKEEELFENEYHFSCV